MYQICHGLWWLAGQAWPRAQPNPAFRSINKVLSSDRHPSRKSIVSCCRRLKRGTRDIKAFPSSSSYSDGLPSLRTGKPIFASRLPIRPFVRPGWSALFVAILPRRTRASNSISSGRCSIGKATSPESAQISWFAPLNHYVAFPKIQGGCTRFDFWRYHIYVLYWNPLSLFPSQGRTVRTVLIEDGK